MRHWPSDPGPILDAAPIGIVVTDPTAHDNPVTYVNDQFCRITGYAPQQVLGHNMRMLQGPDSEPATIAAMHDAVMAGRPMCCEITDYRADGTPFPARVEIRPVFVDDGRLVAFVGGLTDLTEQRDAAERLRESEERLRAVTAAIPLPMLTVRMDGTIARANPAAHEVLGVAPGTLPGRTVYDFVLAESEDPGRVAIRHALEGTGPVKGLEMRARRQDGKELWVQLSAQRFTVRGETRTLTVFHDITELKDRERQLTLANEEAERNIRARMRFLAAASHDLRQPLQAMALFASALDPHVSTPQARTIIASLKTSLRSMEEMFDSLLDMSKLDAGVMKADPVEFLVGDVFEQLEATYAHQAEAAGLEFHLVPSSAAVVSDPRLLARIVGNFLSNAIRYTRQGKILVGARRRGDSLRISVFDTGPGIPRSQRLAIFEEFRRGEASGACKESGSGLGLAIVRRLAWLLGHRLHVRSIEGKGSAFSVDVPLAEEAWAPEDEEVEEEPVPELGGATVVVVDDDRDIQDGLSLLLEEWGCKPVVAATFDEARSALHEKGACPDLILADLHLRNRGSGLAVIDDLRAQCGRAIPAFLFTGDTETAGEADHGVPILHKPIDPGRLRALMATALGR